MNRSGRPSGLNPNCAYRLCASRVANVHCRSPCNWGCCTMHSIQKLPQPHAPIRFENENVAEISVGCIVGNDSRKSDLFPTVKYSKAQRILDRAGNHVARYALRPVTVTQEYMDYIQIKPRAIRAHDELGALMLHRLHDSTFVQRRLLGWRLTGRLRKATTGAKAQLTWPDSRGPEGPLFHVDAGVCEFSAAANP